MVFVVLDVCDVRDRVLFSIDLRPKDRPDARAPKDSATSKLLEGVRRSSSLASDDEGEPGSASLGLG